ncbi:hypothetical protein EXIGLDRAFT_716976, partial [Exidia glandulosa HHB12029]
ERGRCSVSRRRSENVRGRQGRRREKLAIQDSREDAQSRGGRLIWLEQLGMSAEGVSVSFRRVRNGGS